MERSRAELMALVTDASPSVAYDLVEPLLRVMSLAREACEGDLEKALLMVAITLRSSRHPDYRKLDDATAKSARALPGFGTNIRSIADSTGVPRETARRKIQQLIDVGWVEWIGPNLCYSAQGYREVERVRVAILDMYVRGSLVIDALDQANPAT